MDNCITSTQRYNSFYLAILLNVCSPLRPSNNWRIGRKNTTTSGVRNNEHPKLQQATTKNETKDKTLALKGINDEWNSHENYHDCCIFRNWLPFLPQPCELALENTHELQDYFECALWIYLGNISWSSCMYVINWWQNTNCMLIMGLFYWSFLHLY